MSHLVRFTVEQTASDQVQYDPDTQISTSSDGQACATEREAARQVKSAEPAATFTRWVTDKCLEIGQL
jgi:putative ATP-grasp target RiPP